MMLLFAVLRVGLNSIWSVGSSLLECAGCQFVGVGVKTLIKKEKVHIFTMFPLLCKSKGNQDPIAAPGP